MSRRNKAVVIRFTEDEWRLLNDKVKKAKMPREKFCRVVLLGAKINAPPDADYVSLILAFVLLLLLVYLIYLPFL